MNSDAVDLKSEREKRKVSLDRIAADTKISLRYLQCIEEGRFSDLPGGVYARAFIKAYCECINLDPQEVLKRYEALQITAQNERHLKTEMPLSSKSSFSIPGPLIIWSVMLLISALGVYLSRGWIFEIFSPYFSQKPAESVKYETAGEMPPETVVQLPSALQDEGFQSVDSAPEPALSESAPSPANPPAVVSEQKAGQTAEQSPPALNTRSGLRLELSTTEQCWVSLDIDGVPSIRKLMQPGESEVFSAQTSIHILIGNAGGVRMKINDRPTKPLGKPGEVIRLDIDPQNLDQFFAVPEG